MPFTAAELLKQTSRENGASSRHEALPALESPSSSLYEFNQRPHTSYGRRSFSMAANGFSLTSLEPLILPNNDVWENASATWTRNSSPMSDTSATSSLLERHSHSHAEVHHRVGGGGGDWNLVHPTPSQFRQYRDSFPSQWNDLSLVHSSVDQVPFYIERVGVN
jgi:hypothetical protein